MFHFGVESYAVFGEYAVYDMPLKCEDIRRGGCAAGIDYYKGLVLIDSGSASFGTFQPACVYKPCGGYFHAFGQVEVRHGGIVAAFAAGDGQNFFIDFWLHHRIAEKAARAAELLHRGKF